MRAPAIVALLTYLLFASGCAHISSQDHRGDARNVAVAEPMGPHTHGRSAATDRNPWRAKLIRPVAFNAPVPDDLYDHPYLLDTGDQIRILVYGEPDLSRRYRVGHNGKISAPLIGSVKVRGKTVDQLKRIVAARLGARYIREPLVTVDIAQNRPFFILGEVVNAGQYPYVSGMTVRSAVAIAGGYTDSADQSGAKLTRHINGFVEEYEVPFHYLVRPGDTIDIREGFFLTNRLFAMR